MFVIPKVEALRQRRIAQGLDMKGLSIKAGLPGNAILRIEKGECARTNHLRAQSIADALGCQVEDIFIIPSRTGQTAASNKQQKGNHHERIDSVSESGVWQASHSRH